MPNSVIVVLAILAAWRLTNLLRWEEGPAKVFIRLRELMGIQHDAEGVPVSWPESFPAKIFSCPRCLSVWVAGFIMPLVVWAPWWSWGWLGIAGGVSILIDWANALYREK